MKKISVTIFSILFLSQCTPVLAAYDMDTLITALIEVESGGNNWAIGDSGNAAGCLQQWPIFVDDCNRIAKTRYTYDDRFSRQKSINMAKIYLNHYAPPKSCSYEQAARRYNGGSRGDKKESTKKYWIKVQRVLQSQSTNKAGGK